MKLNINWKNLAKAVGITAAIAAAFAFIGFLSTHAPWVIGCIAAAIIITCIYCVLNAVDE